MGQESKDIPPGKPRLGLWGTLPALALVLALSPAPGGGAGGAAAAEVGCNALVSRIKAGESYMGSLDIQRQAVRIETAGDYCYESVDAWVKRGIPLIPDTAPQTAAKPAAGPMPRIPSGAGKEPGEAAPRGPRLLAPPPMIGPDGRVLPSITDAERETAPPSMSFSGRQKGLAKPVAPLPGQIAPPAQTGDKAPASTGSHTLVGASGEVVTHPAGEGTGVPGATGVPGGAAGATAGGEGKDEGPACDRYIANFWGEGTVIINAKRFWMLGAYTLDMDGDGKIDNVVFKTRTKGRVDNVLRYFPSEPGKPAGQDIADLKLDRDEDIYRLCPGEIAFEAPSLAEMVSEEAAAKKNICEMKLDDYWEAGYFEVRGKSYWLSGVFAIDLDGNGAADNVGFKIKTPGKVGNVIRYFGAAPGQLSGQVVPDLALEDDNDIFRICPGNLTFEKPKQGPEVAENKEPEPQKNVTGIQQVESEKAELEVEVKEAETPLPFNMNMLILAAGVLLIFGSLFAFYWMSRGSGKDEYEEIEEENEEEE